MSKGLEALEKLWFGKDIKLCREETYDIIENELKRLEELQKEWEMEHTLRIRLENIVYEKSEVLRIIKEKRVDIQLLIDSKNLNEYNWCVHTKDRALTQQEFDLLKEYF